MNYDIPDQLCYANESSASLQSSRLFSSHLIASHLFSSLYFSVAPSASQLGTCLPFHFRSVPFLSFPFSHYLHAVSLFATLALYSLLCCIMHCTACLLLMMHMHIHKYSYSTQCIPQLQSSSLTHFLSPLHSSSLLFSDLHPSALC